MPDVYTATGAKIYVAPATAAEPVNAAAYAALTWTEITLVESIPPYGDKSSVITAAVLGDGRMRKAKGARDAGDGDLVVFPKDSDAGQLALIAGEATYLFYPIKVLKPNRLTGGGTDGIDYFWALITSYATDIGANDNIVRDRFGLATNSKITRVVAT